MTPFPRLLIVLLCAAFALQSCAPEPERGPVILAPASMQEVMEAIADAWEATGHARPVLSIAGTPAIARQVAEGAPADIIITADAEWMDWLEGRDHIDSGTRRNVAGNSLVFVWTDMHLEIPPRTLAYEVPYEPRDIAMADPDNVPAGRYARQALESAGLWDQLSGRIVPTENVRAALVLVDRHEIDLGIVYASDVHGVGGLFSAPLPGSENVAPTYPAALVATSQNDGARAVLGYLTSAEGRAVFCAHGFSMLEEQQPC